MMWLNAFFPSWLKWLAVGLMALAGAFYAGKLAERQSAALRAAEATTETIERIEDAIANPDGCAWADRLLGACD